MLPVDAKAAEVMNGLPKERRDKNAMHTNGTLRIRIVGGSLGGLFAAALLRMDGHQVRIYERSLTGLAGRGAGLVGQRDIFAILRAVGCEHVAHVGVIALERITFDRDGGVTHRQATPQMQISWDHLYRAFRALVAAMTMFWETRCVRSDRPTNSRAWILKM